MAEDIHIELRGPSRKLMRELHALAKARPEKPPILEVCIAGPAGCGKSVGDAVLLYWIGHRFPGCRMLVLRDKRVDLATTFQKIWEENVVPQGHRMLKKKRDRVSRRAYNFWNGPCINGEHPTIGASVIELGGMDNVTRFRSADYDVILFVELTELWDEEVWGELVRRSLRGYMRSGMPFQLALGETNPGDPGSWILSRAEHGILRLMKSVHRDNPALWDKRTKQWTPFGSTYIESLDMLPEGSRKQSLRWGKWTAADGVVFENFDRQRHIVKRQPPSDLGIRWYAAAMDWGYRDACVLLVGGVTGDGKVYIVAEWYVAGDASTAIEGQAVTAKGSLEWWAKVVGEANRRFQLLGMAVSHERPDVRDRFNLEVGSSLVDRPWAIPSDPQRPSGGEGDMGGLDLVRSYLASDRVVFFDDSLQHDPDTTLRARNRCFRTTMEFGQYIYRKAPASGAKLQGRMRELTDPACDDHGMDTLRYLLKYVDGRTGLMSKANAPKMSPEDQEVARAMGRKIE